LLPCFLSSPDGRREWVNLLEKGVRRHTNVPGAIGSRAASLANKMAVLMHSWLLQTLTVERLRCYLASHVSLTTDFGTESKMADTPNMELDGKLLPGGDAPLLDHDVGEGSHHRSLAQYEHLMPHTLQVGGVLHILANALSQVHTHLQAWHEYLPLLSAVAHFLHFPDYRRRLQERNFSSPRLAVFRTFFDNAAGQQLVSYIIVFVAFFFVAVLLNSAF
jgi:hypothetical protein